jgi:hypothetical protein
MRRTVFTFTADIEGVHHTIPVCMAFHRNKRLLSEDRNYSGEADRDFDLCEALMELVDKHIERGPFRFRNAVLTVTRFGRNGPRSRCVDPAGSVDTKEFFSGVLDHAWRNPGFRAA